MYGVCKSRILDVIATRASTTPQDGGSVGSGQWKEPKKVGVRTPPPPTQNMHLILAQRLFSYSNSNAAITSNKDDVTKTNPYSVWHFAFKDIDKMIRTRLKLEVSNVTVIKMTGS